MVFSRTDSVARLGGFPANYASFYLIGRIKLAFGWQILVDTVWSLGPILSLNTDCIWQGSKFSSSTVTENLSCPFSSSKRMLQNFGLTTSHISCFGLTLELFEQCADDPCKQHRHKCVRCVFVWELRLCLHSGHRPFLILSFSFPASEFISIIIYYYISKGTFGPQAASWIHRYTPIYLW